MRHTQSLGIDFVSVQERKWHGYLIHLVGIVRMVVTGHKEDLIALANIKWCLLPPPTIYRGPIIELGHDDTNTYLDLH